MKILAVDDLHNSFETELRKHGHEVEYKLDLSTTSALIKIINEYDALVVRSKFYISKEIVDVLPRGFIVARAGAGMDNIDEQYALEKGVRLINAPEGNRDAVAEHVIGLLITSYRNILKSDSEIRTRKWLREENRGIELKGKTIGIIGFGNTGSSLAKKLSGFEMRILAYDKYLSKIEHSGIEQVSLKVLKEESDIISMHVPLTSETCHMLNAEFFNSLRRKPFIINASRGKVIETSELVKAIKFGKILGAALDVLENEKFESYNTADNEWFADLLSSPRVIMTSHIAGWTQESYRRISEVLVQKLLQSQV